MSTRITVLFSAVFLAFSGCASAKLDQQLNEKLAKENPHETRALVRGELSDLIKSAPGLTAEQRAKLRNLKTTALTEADRLREESYKLRAVLIKDILAPTYDSEEVALLKAKLQKLEDERLAVFLNAVRDTNLILGRWASRASRESADNQFYQTQAIYEMIDPYGL